MPTGFPYSSFEAAVATQIPTLTTDVNFTTILPAAIDYAELSIYRDLDLLPMHGQINLGTTTAATQTVALPAAIVAFDSLYCGTSNTPLTPASLDFVVGVYGGAANAMPQYFALVGAAAGSPWAGGRQVYLGPIPDQAYPIMGFGSEREAPLSATNTTTWISTWLPDLFWAAAMIFLAGYNRNFGAMSDDPRQAISWETEYQRLLKGAMVDEMRVKFRSRQPMPAPMAAPMGAPQGGV